MNTSIETNEANAPAAPARSRRISQPAIRTRFEIPIPPSTNALWFNLPNGKGRARTKAYCAWLTAAGWELKAQHVCPVPDRFVSLAVYAGLTERERDLDNILKAIGDLLQHNGIIENDRAIVQIRALWDRTVPTDRVRVEVRKTIGPLQRMTAEARARSSAERRGVPWGVRNAHLISATTH
jgi:Holliday junction resolvase RusA-like endonuclease